MSGRMSSQIRHDTVQLPFSAPSVPSDDEITSGAAFHDISTVDRFAYSMSQQTARPTAQGDLSCSSQDTRPTNLGHVQRVKEQSALNYNTVDEVDPLGRDVKEAVALMGKLETLGLQKLNISIPQCIVLGQQSTGKSSVIEAISGIKTPRDTGTCTCCPLYITMQSTTNPRAEWVAHVSLQQDYDLDTQPRRRGAAQPFPGWVPAQTSRQISFAKTNSPTELELIIRRAQAANLSPLEAPETFSTILKPQSGAHRSKFSPNLVRIDITQPGLPDLSFYDLPGIISQAETEEEAHTVPLVQNLVADYVKRPDSLILVTCDLGTDIANSTAAGLARRYNATERCIGVLTKPDLLPPGTSDAVLADVLDGKRFKLGHRYFVVKNLDKEQIRQGLSHRDARIKEDEFFASGRWASSLQHFQPRFGTLKLQQYISKQLAQQTLRVLPAIHEQINSRLQEVEAALIAMPETPAHSAVRIIADILLAFSSNVRDEMQGEHEHTTWRNTWEAICAGFDDALVAMRPCMTISGGLDRGIYTSSLSGGSIDQAIVLESGEEDEDGDDRTSEIPETPTKKRKVDEGSPAPSPFRTPVQKSGRRMKATPTQPPGSNRSMATNTSTELHARFKLLRTRFLLDEVTRDMKQSSKSKVPGQIHHKVREAMMLSALKEWTVPIDAFFDDLEKNLLARIQLLFHKHFQGWLGSELYRSAWAIVDDLLRNNFTEQRTIMATESLHDELDGPYIFYKDQFAQEKAQMRAKYRQAREQVRFKIFVREAGDKSGRDLQPAEQDKIRKDEKKMALIRDEPYETEIDLIADVASYYIIASRRLHDSICMRIESKLFKQLRNQLRDELESRLRIYDDTLGPEKAVQLLAGSPEREQCRRELVAKKAALMQALDYLRDFGNRYRGDSSSQSFENGTIDPAGDRFCPPLATTPADEA